MTWTKAVIFAVLIVTAIVVPTYYRMVAGTYAFWRWGREA
jgi:hypothetical protein